MSLTSYLAAPPRGRDGGVDRDGGGYGGRGVRLQDLAATYSPTSLQRSTIGAGGFHGRVRDGVGWFTAAMAARSCKRTRRPLGRAVW